MSIVQLRRLLLEDRRGFTFLELIVGVAIIAITAAGAMSDVIATIKESKTAQAKDDIRQLANAIQRYYVDTGNYPATTDKLKTQDATTGKGPWLKSLPVKDPWGNNYIYTYTAGTTAEIKTTAPDGTNISVDLIAGTTSGF